MFDEFLDKIVKVVYKDGTSVGVIRGMLIEFDSDFIAIETLSPKKRILIAKSSIFKLNKSESK